jgi:hypothetical protein
VLITGARLGLIGYIASSQPLSIWYYPNKRKQTHQTKGEVIQRADQSYLFLVYRIMATDHSTRLGCPSDSESAIQDGAQSPVNMSVSAQVLMKFQQDIRESVRNCENLINEDHNIMLEHHDQTNAVLDDIQLNVADSSRNSENMHNMILERIEQIAMKIDSLAINASPGGDMPSTPTQCPPSDVQAVALQRAQQRIEELEIDLANSRAHNGGPGSTISEESAEEMIRERTKNLEDQIEEMSDALNRSEEDNQRNKHKQAPEHGR